jgi:hypothetical protein
LYGAVPVIFDAVKQNKKKLTSFELYKDIKSLLGHPNQMAFGYSGLLL